MNQTLKVALISLPLSFTSLVEAEGYKDSILNSWYMGAGIGVNNYQQSHQIRHDFDERMAAWNVFTGYQFNDYFDIKLGYHHLGHSTWLDLSNNHNDISASGVSLSMLASYPLEDNWRIIFEAGAINYLLSNNLNFGRHYYSDKDFAPYAGIGIGHMITSNLSISANYRRFEEIKDRNWNTLDLDANYWGLEFSYHFGPSSKSVAKPLVTHAPTSDEILIVVDSDNDGIPDNEDQCANSPANHQVNAIGCTLYLESEEVFTIDANFPHDSSKLSRTAVGEIETLADIMKENPKSVIEIKGFASNVGDPDYNLKLSQKRADAAAHMLEYQFGIASHRITARGYGIHQPLILGNTKEAHKANRRIEANLTVIIINPAMK